MEEAIRMALSSCPTVSLAIGSKMVLTEPSHFGDVEVCSKQLSSSMHPIMAYGEKRVNQEEIDKLLGAYLEANSTKRFEPTAFA